MKQSNLIKELLLKKYEERMKKYQEFEALDIKKYPQSLILKADELLQF